MSDYVFPSDVEIPLLIQHQWDDTLTLIQAGAKRIEQTGFQPTFTAIANAVLCDNDDTIEMVKQVQEDAGITFGDIPIIGASFTLFAMALTVIKEKGWDEYVDWQRETFKVYQ